MDKELWKEFLAMKQKQAYSSGRSMEWRLHFDKRLDALFDVVKELPKKAEIKEVKGSIKLLWGVVLLIVSLIFVADLVQ